MEKLELKSSQAHSLVVMQYMLVTSERLLSKGVPLNDISIFYSSQGVIVVIFVFLLLYYPSNMVCGFDFEK